MNDLIENTGLIDIESVVVRQFLERNKIQTVEDLLRFDVNAIAEMDVKNIVRGAKDLFLYRYKSLPLPFDTYLNSEVKYVVKDNSNVTVDFGKIDLYRMGFAYSEQLELKSVVMAMYNEFKDKTFSLIDVLRNIVLHHQDNPLYKKASTFIEYYDNDKKITSGENTMSKLYYLRDKLDVTYERYDDVARSRELLRGVKGESRRTNN